ncbi:hypothetical protein B0H10DRAFT_1949457 [Mycena sp. CBHHK59/15]|nr:hypothetical protein B0H10DRAFT_1949457 [Mycena sp. CBHHK59/15]
MSSVTEDSIGSQYPQYNGPQAIQAINSFLGYTLQLLQCSFAGNQSESGSRRLLTTVNIDRIANESKMSIEQRRSAHEFSLPNEFFRPPNPLVPLCGANRKPTGGYHCQSSLNANDTGMSPFALQPGLETFGGTRIVSTVQICIPKHGEDLHLAVYKTDLIVKKITDKLLADAYNNLKSAFRKLVFDAVTKKMIVDKHHLPIIPDIVPQSILAAVALMYGSDRKSAAWLEWEKNIIADNNTKYDRGNRGRDAATGREELDLAAGLGEPLTGDTGGGYTLLHHFLVLQGKTAILFTPNVLLETVG